MTDGNAESGWRGSRELWLSAAYDSLVASGVDSVRIQPLGKRVKLSRTSFYWFFKDRDELLEALLQMWRDKNTGSLVAKTLAYAESITEATLNVFDCWHDQAIFDSEFEFAVRSWALQSEHVGQEVRKADEVRIGALAAMFVRFGFDQAIADVRARTIYLTQIGYISMNAGETVERRMGRVPQYVEIFTGCRAKTNELARFYARRGIGDAGPDAFAA